MCGIAGFWSQQPLGLGENKQVGIAMARAMQYRGPDNQSILIDDNGCLTLAHARLSVIDLSESANQPFVSDDGQTMLVYNGEVYNFADLRKELITHGLTFRTSSDTEVILIACRYWGVHEAAKRLKGMFAFAYWDKTSRLLHLVRDPIGIKPLFYGRADSTFFFASTLTALQKHPKFKKHVSSDALAAYLRYSYVPAPYSIFENVFKLPAAHILTINESGEQKIERYWDALAIAQRGIAQPIDASDSEIENEFDRLLRTSVKESLVSDVPIGAFLSGGIDSSLIAALMQSEGTQNARTFTIGFSDARYDESKYARRVANYLGCDHTEMICTTNDAQRIISDIPQYYDEPFADSSQIPTLLLSKLTRKSVTVALSGDGGDELFGGYDRYYWMERLQRAGVLPSTIKILLAKAANHFPRDITFPLLSRIPKGNKVLPTIDGWYHIARMMESSSNYGYLYKTTPMTVCNHWDTPLLLNRQEPSSIIDNQVVQAKLPQIMPWMRFIDQETYLTDDILQKIDRATMAFSLEARVPYLNHQVVEFAWAVPERLKLVNGRGKILMRNLLGRHLPTELIERPKRGFSIPLSDWLKGDLREWAESLIDLSINDPLLDSEGVRNTWKNFLTGRAEHTLTTTWALLIYLQWRKHFFSS